MKLSNGRDFRLNLWPRVRIAVRTLAGFPVTFGEVAEANGEGPCGRCVGRALAPMMTEKPAAHLRPPTAQELAAIRSGPAPRKAR